MACLFCVTKHKRLGKRLNVTTFYIVVYAISFIRLVLSVDPRS